jgi:hypothetical protein
MISTNPYELEMDTAYRHAISSMLLFFFGVMCHAVQNQMESGFMKMRKGFIEILGNIGGCF